MKYIFIIILSRPFSLKILEIPKEPFGGCREALLERLPGSRAAAFLGGAPPARQQQLRRIWTATSWAPEPTASALLHLLSLSPRGTNTGLQRNENTP